MTRAERRRRARIIVLRRTKMAEALMWPVAKTGIYRKSKSIFYGKDWFYKCTGVGPRSLPPLEEEEDE